MRKCPIHEIANRAENASIPFLVIGGYAVIAHGYVRTTDDLDLLIERGRRAHSSKLVTDLGMSVKNDAANFAQFESQSDSEMNIDLMFVSESVFSQLNSAAIQSTLDGVSVRVVSLPHLIALKCHAIKNSDSRLRVIKDTDDLVHLIVINRLDLNEAELRANILKHEIRNSMKSSNTPAPNDEALHDAPALEFPDWSGMLPHHSRMTFEEAVHWNDKMLSMFPGRKLPRLESERPCDAEFIL